MNYINSYRCCVCGGRVISEEDITICENCNNIYHKLCWQEVKGECIHCYNKIKTNKISNEKTGNNIVN